MQEQIKADIQACKFILGTIESDISKLSQMAAEKRKTRDELTAHIQQMEQQLSNLPIKNES
jgi:septal ring factor EnvC (AmiA/AmiB activator)